MPGVLTKSKKNSPLAVEPIWRANIDDHPVALAWCPDRTLLAVAAAGGPITLYDAKTGEIHAALPGHGFGTAALSWNADGSLLASAGQDGKARIWEASSGRERVALDAGAAWVERVAWCPVAPFLATAAGKKMRLWNPEGALLRTYEDHTSTIADLTWKPRSRELSTASYGGLTMWGVEKDEPLKRHEWQGSTLVISWSPDKRYIATGDQDSTVHFWIAKTGKDLQMWGYPTKVRELAWDSTGRYLATGGSDTVVVWDCSGRGPEGSTPTTLEGHEAYLTTLAYQHAGPILASGGQDGQVILWQPASGRAARGGFRFDESVTQLAWSSHDRWLAAGDETGEIVVVGVS